MSSRGAWPFYYEMPGLDFLDDPQGRDAHGIYAMKRELAYNGFSQGVDLTKAAWGMAAESACRAAQASFGITVDGVLGPVTARYLFRKRMTASELVENLPVHRLAQIASLESGNDPVAQGVADPQDEGLFQENLPSNPSLTQIECWTPSFIVPTAAKQLASRISACAGSAKAGTAAWNVGNFYANGWRQAGFPASGGPVVNGEDMWARADHYYRLVTDQPL